MTEAMSYHRSNMSPTRMLDESSQDRRGSNGSGMRRDSSSTATLLTREQQLKEEIARLRREEQELTKKDYLLKQDLYALREQMALQKRHY